MVYVFDLDDTICETNVYSEKYILNFFNTHKKEYPYKQIQKVSRFAEGKFNWDVPMALSWYKKYGDEMMLNFPCKKHSVEVINALHDLGERIVFSTARSTDWHTKPEEITREWLAKNKFKYDKLYIGRIDKEKICEIENADVFMDDDIKTTQRVGDHFLKIKPFHSFLMTSEYNREYLPDDHVKRILDFDDFAIKLRSFGIDIDLEKGRER